METKVPVNKLYETLNRRSFLKSSGLVAGAAVIGAGSAEASEASREGTSASAATDGLVSLVDLFQGTDSTRTFSRGNTLPIAARPFGMAHWTLQSEANTPWMFQPGERRIQGFRSTHQLSPWLGDYDHATFLPFYGTIQPEAAPRASSTRLRASPATRTLARCPRGSS